MPEGRKIEEINLLHDQLDRIWGSGQEDSANKRTINSYEDYFFSGEDVKIFIDGLYDPEYELDIASFAFSVRQEKQPIYGFWSYNYDHMLLGTRIIMGEISIFTTDPRKMTSLLEEASRRRMQDAQSRSLRSLGQGKTLSMLRDTFTSHQDDININKYWSTSQLDRIANDPYSEQIEENRNIFSAHPPFNFLILHGAEEVALSPLSGLFDDRTIIQNDLSRNMHSDVNQRTVRNDNNTSPKKTIIQEVNLVSMTTSYSPGGQPVVENYQFIARDLYFTKADLSFLAKKQVTDNSGLGAIPGSPGVLGNSEPEESAQATALLPYERFNYSLTTSGTNGFPGPSENQVIEAGLPFSVTFSTNRPIPRTYYWYIETLGNTSTKNFQAPRAGTFVSNLENPAQFMIQTLNTANDSELRYFRIIITLDSFDSPRVVATIQMALQERVS
jgi:hypothetical protein